jgi:hypothetical protein
MAQLEKRTIGSIEIARGEDRPSIGQRLRAPAVQRIAVGLALVVLLQILGGILLTPQGALLVVGPITLFALPVLGAIADFAIPQLGNRYTGWLAAAIMSAIIACGSIALTLLAQTVVGHIDLVGMFSADPKVAAGHLSAFPFTIPLGALFFVIYLEVAIVSGVPMMTTHRVRDGLVAFAGSIAAGLILYQVLANWASVPPVVRTAIGLRNPGGPLDALDLAGILISITIWQVLYLFGGGWALQRIERHGLRIALSNATVIGLGITTFWVLHTVARASVPQIAVIGAMVVVGTLVVGILFGMPAAVPPHQLPVRQRLYRLGLAGVVALFTFVALYWLGTTLQPRWVVGSLELWIAICALNLIGGGTMLYCRILLPFFP